MSAQQDLPPSGGAPPPNGRPPAGGFGAGARPEATAWRTRSDGSKVFQLQTPVIFWWVWVVFSLVCLIDIAVQGRDRASVQAATAVVAATGFAYACAFRPKVLADEAGITVLNPIRDFRVPWSGLKGIFLGDSVEFQVARRAPKTEKVVYSWALYTKRRSRARAKLRGQSWDRRATSPSRPAGYAQMPREAQEAAKMLSAEAMARELGRLREQARQRSAAAGGESAEGFAVAHWAWLPVAAMVIPTIGFVLSIVIR